MFGHWQEDLEYLENKYRRDNAAPETGMDLDELILNVKTLYRESLAPLPAPAAKAAAFDFVCKHVRIGASEHDFFPAFGCWDRKKRPLFWLLCERMEQVKAASLHFNELWDTLRNQGDNALIIDFDHSVPDWDALFSLGFSGILRRTEQWRERHRTAGTPDGKSAVFFDGVISTWRSVVSLLERLSDFLCEHELRSPRLTAERESIERVVAGAPRNTYDALMLIYLYFFLSEHFDCMQVRSLGNLDDRLRPFVESDIAAGTFNEIQIRELLSYFLMQWGSINNYWGHPFYIGGQAPDGSTLCNPVTLMILEEYEKLDITSPKIQFKVAANTPAPFLNKAFELIRKNRNLVFVCESGIRKSMRKLGYSDEIARCCDISGCYEAVPRGSSAGTLVGYVNMLKIFDRMAPDRFGDFESFFARYLEILRERLEEVIRITDDFETHLAEINPAQIFSGTILHALETGRDVLDGGALHNNTSLLCCGFASAVDALSMVRKFVFKRREMTLEQWREILKNDWNGAELFRKKVLYSVERFGNNHPETDDLAMKLALGIDRAINGRPNARGGIWFASSHPALTFIRLGKLTGATPDGRKSGEEMSKNLSPVNGMEYNGCTAVLESVAAVDGSEHFPGDTCLDLLLHPTSTAGEEGIELLNTLLRYYIEHDGYALQFNIFDPNMLRDARKHPEKYGSLMVRVCGWNVRFNDMDPREQDAYIRRAEKSAETGI